MLKGSAAVIEKQTSIDKPRPERRKRESHVVEEVINSPS